MNMKKIGLALSIAAMFGFVACGDDDSSSPVSKGKDSSSIEDDDGDGSKTGDKTRSVDASVDFSAPNNCDFTEEDDSWEFNRFDAETGEVEAHYKYVVSKDGQTITRIKTKIDSDYSDVDPADCEEVLDYMKKYEDEDEKYVCSKKYGLLHVDYFDFGWGSREGGYDEGLFETAKSMCRETNDKENLPKCDKKREGEFWSVYKLGEKDEYRNTASDTYICFNGKWTIFENYSDYEDAVDSLKYAGDFEYDEDDEDDGDSEDEVSSSSKGSSNSSDYDAAFAEELKRQQEMVEEYWKEHESMSSSSQKTIEEIFPELFGKSSSSKASEVDDEENVSSSSEEKDDSSKDESSSSEEESISSDSKDHPEQAPFKWDGLNMEYKVNTGLDNGSETSGSWYVFGDGAESVFAWPVGVGEGFDEVIDICGGLCGLYTLESSGSFVGLAFDVVGKSADDETVIESADVTDWGGICVTYSSDAKITMELGLGSEEGADVAILPYANFARSLALNEVCVKWSEFEKGSVTGAAAAESLGSIRFKFQGLGGLSFNIQSVRSYKTAD